MTEQPDRTARHGQADDTLHEAAGEAAQHVVDEVKQDEARGTPQVRSAQVADGAEAPTADQG